MVRSWSVRAALAAVMLAAIALAGAGAALAQGTVQLPSFVTVGLGYVVVPADRVVVSVGIETQGESAEAAQKANEGIAAAIESRLEALGLEGLSVSRRRINLWQQRPGALRREEGGYRASSGLDVSILREEDVGKVIDVAMALGAASVQGVSFQASGLEAAAKEALALAVKDAVAKAETISRATGMRLVMIRRVHDAHKIDIINPSDPVLVEAGEAVRPPYHVPVQRGEILVQVQVTVEFDVGVQQ